MRMANYGWCKYGMMLALLLVASLAMLQCDDSGSTGVDGDDTTSQCVSHQDCPIGFSCNITSGVCGQDPYAVLCTSDVDCNVDYTCYISADSLDGTGKCVPITVVDGDPNIGDGDTSTGCTTDDQCEATEFCYQGTCQDKNPTCTGNADCWPGQYCDPTDGICKGEIVIDGDKDTVDGDPDAVIDGDDDNVVDGDPDTVDGDEDEPVDGDIPVGQPCDRTSDCPVGSVCGPSGVCIEHCQTSGCTAPAHCNPNNGYCEYCDQTCAASQCCNYNVDFWYCGGCCVPPCSAGNACQAGTCIPLQCPTCSPGEYCDGANTGYICVDDPTQDTGEGERGNVSCLPANSACIEGVDICCSGTCLMGTCL